MSQQALFVEAIGHPVVLGTWPIPEPRENEILVKVISVGWPLHWRQSALHPRQRHRRHRHARRNSRLALPASDHVFSQTGAGFLDRGGLQQYALVDADLAARIPDSLTDDAVATFPTNAMAAFVALFHASGCGVPPPYAPPAERDAFRAERHAVVVLGAGANCRRMGV
ncbi:uncharacterized protein K441DRAFT_700581 [Cenococcum geophilum 1.58]|uniref:Uncharacterized protein n=1 Tax=Cenococcum geophilum 1.58 TaxID=794803 RepID=A0ACC8EPW3_9PEZI|nr:hypothetical protein K441DRAFT_700581 [Cenococcum geophilum 1.58]